MPLVVENNDSQIDEIINDINSRDTDEEYSEALDRSIEWEINQADQGFEEIFTESASNQFEGFPES